jgi:DNA-binding transcriptional LysR family regulator
MAEHGHGIAVVPSVVQANRYALNVIGVTYRGEPLRERLAIFRDARRTLPPYAAAFCNMLAEYTRDVLPLSRPTARRGRTRVKPG